MRRTTKPAAPKTSANPTAPPPNASIRRVLREEVSPDTAVGAAGGSPVVRASNGRLVSLGRNTAGDGVTSGAAASGVSASATAVIAVADAAATGPASVGDAVTAAGGTVGASGATVGGAIVATGTTTPGCPVGVETWAAGNGVGELGTMAVAGPCIGMGVGNGVPVGGGVLVYWRVAVR